MEYKRILVVDDEPQITRVLRHSLAAHGYDVRTAADGESALDTIKDFRPNLVITDLQMPGMGGLDLCRHIREMSQIPIVVLSVKGEERTKVAALDAGADDYVTKPFGMDELLARVRAALRRVSVEPVSEEPRLSAGDFEIDRDTHRAVVRGEEVHLTPKEMELLIFLVSNPGKVLTHRVILKAVWGANAVTQPEYLRVFVGNLRKKIEPEISKPKYIITEPWVGYRFEPSG
jgi:two-component system KDP operon response regulator KdpE